MDARAKKLLLRVGIGLGAGLAGVGAVWGWLLPAAVHARAEQALGRLTGMDPEVRDASVGINTATFRGVVLSGQHGGVGLQVEEVAATVGLGALVLGEVSIHEVVARGVTLEADLGHDGAERSIEAVRDARSGAEGVNDGAAEGDRGGRRYQVEDLQVDVRGPGGASFAVQGGTLVRKGQAVSGRAASVRASSSAGHQVAVRAPSGTLVKAGSGWQLSTLDVQEGTVVLRQHGADEDGAQKDEPPGSRGGGWRSDVADALEHMADDAHVRVRDLTIRSRTAEEDGTILEALELTLEGRGPGVLASAGAGRAPGGGELRWEAELRPPEARAEGTLRFDRLPLALATPLLPDLPWHHPERARLDGELVVNAESAAKLAFRGRMALTDAAVFSPRIAPEAVNDISFLVEGAGHWVPAARRLVLDEAKVATPEAFVRMNGALEWAEEHYLVDLTAELPSTPCGQVLSVIPPDLRGETAGFSWRGEMGGHLKVHVDSRELQDTDLDIHVADGCQFESVPSLANLQRFRGVFDHQVEEPDGSVFEMTTGPGTPHWQPVRSISPFLVHAVLAHEDAGYFRHHGFAPWAIEGALARNLEAGRFVVGASTVTMQLAKNLFLRREKTLARKVQEVILTWWLENALDKQEILELYLNVIEYGPEVYGITSAAWYYFGRTPADLSPAESAFLATILPNPKAYADQHRRDELEASTAARMRRLLQHMHAKGRIDEAALEYGLQEIASFDFHHEGDPEAEPRTIPGQAAPLPLGIADEGPAGFSDDWRGFFDDEEAAPDAAPDPFRELPEVDPDAL
ncbi:MAG: transglycosylase domain-containing protein [Myxococcota bacterium]